VKPGDLVLVPHGGERFGKVLARVRSVASRTVTVEPWSPSARTWRTGRGERIVFVDECTPAPESDRRVKAVRRMESKVPGKGGEELRPCD
jgi:hypothetical protein